LEKKPLINIWGFGWVQPSARGPTRLGGVCGAIKHAKDDMLGLPLFFLFFLFSCPE
jgi:hypothetical protein